MRYSIHEAEEPSEDLQEAVSRLLPQLDSSKELPKPADLREIIESPGTFLFVASLAESGEAVGMLTLVVSRLPTGVRAYVEDVVVAEAARGQGIGIALVGKAKEKAVELGVKAIDLTSNPAREAANRLYQRVGFRLRKTNVYRLEL